MTMKEAIVNPELAVHIVESPIPEPRAGEILIKVVVSVWLGLTINTGDDIATSSSNSAKGDKMVVSTLYETVGRLAEAIVSAVRESGIEDGRVYNAIDTVGTAQTKELLSKVLAGSPKQGSKPHVTMVGAVDAEGYGDGIDVSQSGVGRIHFEDSERWKTFGLVWGHIFSRGLAQGWLTAHPFEVLKGGLNGLEGGLKALRDGTVRAKKVIVRISDTEGVSS